MFTRISSISALTVLLAACSGGGDSSGEKPVDDGAQGASIPLDDPLAKAEAEADKMRSEADEGKLACAIGDAGQLARVCDLERSDTEKGLLLTVRHPDGGFRRLLVVQDGRGVIAADGAEEAKVTPVGPREIEVELAGNRYRIPATVKGQKAASPAPKK